jgi:predicted transcriptional regulator
MAITKREKRFMTKQEQHLRIMMQKHCVSQSEIADHEDITLAALALRLKSLTPSMLDHLEGVIMKLSNRQAQKIAS